MPVDKSVPIALGARCEECPLANEPYVLGHGPEKADIVIVGEAPGRDEIQRGIPFTGKSGQLMNNVLAYHGIDREEVYVTNACLCRPPGNATPPPKAVSCCHNRLTGEIGSRDPNRVLALGATAAKALLGTGEGITRLRSGGPRKGPYLDVPIIPTFHPAAALRSPDYFPTIVNDVHKLSRVDVVWEHTKFRSVDDPYEAVRLIRKQAEYSKTLACDIEIDVADMNKFDVKNPKWLCIGVSHRPGGAIVYGRQACESPLFQQAFKQVLESKDHRWVYHNGKFDIQFLWSFAPNARVHEDTMLAHYAVDERKGTHDLEQVATEVLGAPSYKQDAKAFIPQGGSFGDVPVNILHQYNAGDVDVTHRLLDPLRKEMANDGTTRAYESLLIPGSNSLAWAEYCGVKIRTEYVDELEVDFLVRLEGHEKKLAKWVLNPRSPIQVKNAFADLGAPIAGTDKGILAEVVNDNRVPEEARRFARALLDYRADHKIFSTYIRGLHKHAVRGRIHPTFLLHGTETGRLSCRRPNLQNIPSGELIRDAFISGPKSVLLSADYNQIEFRLAAILSRDPWLLDQFRQGRQFHKEVARTFFGETWSDLQYLRAKAVNFGILYGRGAGSLAAEHGMSYKEAQRMIDEWFRRMPKVKEFQRGLEAQIREQGHISSFYGRKRRFWLVLKDNWHIVTKEGYNFPLQSTASDLTLMSLIRLEPLLRGKAVPVITVHDSLVWEVRRDCLDEVAETIQRVMEATDVSDICPTPIDIKIGPKWGFNKKLQNIEWYERSRKEQ